MASKTASVTIGDTVWFRARVRSVHEDRVHVAIELPNGSVMGLTNNTAVLPMATVTHPADGCAKVPGRLTIEAAVRAAIKRGYAESLNDGTMMTTECHIVDQVTLALDSLIPYERFVHAAATSDAEGAPVIPTWTVGDRVVATAFADNPRWHGVVRALLANGDVEVEYDGFAGIHTAKPWILSPETNASKEGHAELV